MVGAFGVVAGAGVLALNAGPQIDLGKSCGEQVAVFGGTLAHRDPCILQEAQEGGIGKMAAVGFEELVDLRAFDREVLNAGVDGIDYEKNFNGGFGGADCSEAGDWLRRSVVEN